MIRVGVVLFAAGCSFPLLGKSPTVRFRGEAVDPVGDTASVADRRVARPADLVYARVEITDALPAPFVMVREFAMSN
jgi:hypothetical protein